MENLAIHKPSKGTILQRNFNTDDISIFKTSYKFLIHNTVPANSVICQIDAKIISEMVSELLCDNFMNFMPEASEFLKCYSNRNLTSSF